jgi:hypothetical protein
VAEPGIAQPVTSCSTITTSWRPIPARLEAPLGLGDAKEPPSHHAARLPCHRHFGSVRKLPSGRYPASYWHQALRHIADQTFDTKADAQSWLSEVETEIRRGRWVNPTAGRVVYGNYVDDWLAQRRDIRPCNHELYEGTPARAGGADDSRRGRSDPGQPVRGQGCRPGARSREEGSRPRSSSAGARCSGRTSPTPAGAPSPFRPSSPPSTTTWPPTSTRSRTPWSSPETKVRPAPPSTGPTSSGRPPTGPARPNSTCTTFAAWPGVDLHFPDGGTWVERELYELLMGPQPDNPSRSAQVAAAEAAAVGLQLVHVQQQALDVVFLDIAAVVHFLRKVPWTVPDFTVQRYYDRLAALHAQLDRDGRFLCHSQRYLIELPAAMIKDSPRCSRERSMRSARDKCHQRPGGGLQHPLSLPPGRRSGTGTRGVVGAR